jgi:hypothetical protein
MNIVRALEHLHNDVCEEFTYVKRRLSEVCNEGNFSESMFKHRLISQGATDAIWKVNFPEIRNLTHEQILDHIRKVEKELTSEILTAVDGLADAGEINSTDATMRHVTALKLAGKARVARQLRRIIDLAE